MTPFLPFDLGLRYPALLAGIPLIAAFLVYIYLRHGRAPHVVVSSVLLLRQLRAASFSRKKFIPPPRFFFELLLLAALLLAAAGLFRRGDSRHIALLLDNSLSMSASNTGDGTGLDNLAVARREAASWLSSLGPDVRVEVFSTSPALLSLTKGLVTPAEASTALDIINPASASDHLEALLARFVSDEKYQQVVVYSDRHRAEPAAAPANAAAEQRFLIKSVQSAAQVKGNLAISQLELQQSVLGGVAEDEVVATVSSYAGQDAKIKVILEAARLDDDGQSLRFSESANRELNLAGGASETIRFASLTAGVVAWRVRLELRDLAARRDVNALRADDSAYLAAQREVERVLLVGDLSPEALGLKRISGIKIDYMKPEEYEAADVDKAAALPAIFHRYVPAKLKTGSAIFVMPQKSSDLFTLGREHEGTQITGLLQTHPLLSYINLSAFKLGKVENLVVPLWAKEIISTSAGAAALAGEIDNRRVLVLGFEILPFEGRESPAASILTLNALKWIGGSREKSGYISTGSSLSFASDAPKPIRLTETGLSGNVELETLSAEGRETQIVLQQTGLFRIAKKSEAASDLVAVNYFDASESDLSKLASVELPAPGLSLSPVSEQNSLARIFGLGCLALLLIDLLLSFAGRASGQGVRR